MSRFWSILCCGVSNYKVKIDFVLILLRVTKAGTKSS
jgi:hypothetical protein